MHVLVFTNQYPTKSHQVTNPAVYYQIQGLRKLGVNVDVCQINSGEEGIFSYLTAFSRLRAMWLTGKYDLIHVHFGGIQSLMGVLIEGKKTVVTYHGTDLHGGSPKNHGVLLKNRISVWCSRRASEMAGGVAVVSPNLLRFLPDLVRSESRVFPPGVDYDVFRPESQLGSRKKLNLLSDKKYILFSDISCSPVKRRDIALAIEDKVREKDSDAQLLILTAQPYWRVPLYLNAADCLLLVSEKEGSPNIIKEALAVNLPIVSVDVGDVALRCEGVPNCQIVSRDVALLADGVIKALMMGREGGGRELKRPEIDNECICEQVRIFYQEVLSQAKDNGKLPE